MRNLEIKNQNGRSMIEMLGVLAIIGVLSVGGIAGYSKAMMKYRINKTIEQITLIAGNVRTFFAPQGNYDGLSSNSDTGNAIIKKAKIIPDEMLTITDGAITKIENAFGGSAGFIGRGNFFVLMINKIPQEACIELSTHDWNTISAHAIEVSRADTSIYHYGGGGKGCRSGAQGFGGWLECSQGSMTLEQAIQYCERKDDNAIALAIQ